MAAIRALRPELASSRDCWIVCNSTAVGSAVISALFWADICTAEDAEVVMIKLKAAARNQRIVASVALGCIF